MTTIPLTQGKVALVDDADYAALAGFNWCALRAKHLWYAKRRVPAVGDGKPTVMYMHRQVLGVPKGVKVDHRDGNGLNNQRENLRTASSTENVRNQTRKESGCTSRFKGVSWATGKQRWRASIRDGKKQADGQSRGRHIGYYRSEVTAARAYDKAAAESFGEFAALNFTDGHVIASSQGPAQVPES